IQILPGTTDPATVGAGGDVALDALGATFVDVVIPAGTTGPVDVPFSIFDDSDMEPTETFDLVIVSANTGTTIDAGADAVLITAGEATVSILDDDTPPLPMVSLSVTPGTASEDDGTQVTVAVTATAAVSGAQSVALSLAGTGLTPSDFTTPPPATLTIPDGGTTASVVLTVADDALEEGSETATFSIASPTAGIELGAVTSDSVVITDNDVVANGAATLEVTVFSDQVQISNFGDNSFVFTNTGDKTIVQLDIDVTEALYPDTVFDPFGLAGDDAAKGLTIDTDGGTGVDAPSAASYVGVGGASGYEGLRLTFDETVNGGFQAGEAVGFSVDMDPNSVAGTTKTPLDNGSDPFWDVGGVSGAELIGSSFTVTFSDGTTATGQLMGAANQAGSKGVADQSTPNSQVSVTANGLSAGEVGTYDSSGVSVIVNGPAGETARVVLTKGFIQPTVPYTTELEGQLALLAASDFPANNAVEFQTVDVVLTGGPQDISSLFDLSGVPIYDFAGEDELALGTVAAVIDPDDNDLPLGAVTDPIYLTFGSGTGNSAPVIDAISFITVDETEQVTAQINATDADPGDTISLSMSVLDNTTGLLVDSFDFIDNGDGTGDFTWDTPDVPQDRTFTATVNAFDGTSLATTTFDITVNDDSPPVLFRWNAGSFDVAAIDGGPDWTADTSVLTGGPTNVAGASIASTDVSVPTDTTPFLIFSEERWDPSGGGEMALSFGSDLAVGDYAVRLFLGNSYVGTSQEGQRVFDISVEGEQLVDDFDPVSAFGHEVGGMIEWSGLVDDGTVDIDFDRVVENPLISAVEVLYLA
ncbi:MAG: malectin domain-containing carbohydrate-binding protein, partial [Pseudomonadota bacterium]